MERKSPLKGEIIAAILLLGATVILILFLALSEKGEKEIRAKDKDFFEYFDTICTLYDYSGDEDAVFEENPGTRKNWNEIRSWNWIISLRYRGWHIIWNAAERFIRFI